MNKGLLFTLLLSLTGVIAMSMINHFQPELAIQRATINFDKDVRNSNAEFASLSCRSNIQLSLGNQGYGVLEPQMLLADQFQDYTRFEVVIVDPPVGSDTADCSMVGDRIKVEVRDTINDIMCWSNVLVEDKLPPQTNCDTVDVRCNIDPYAPNTDLFLPDLTDNCTNDTDLVITFNQTNISQNCQSPYVLIIDRSWFISDESGNTTNCNQIIRLVRPNMDSIIFPENDTLYCPDTDTDPSITGVPILYGEPVSVQCDLMVWNEDSQIDKCGETFKLFRRWYVMDWCRNLQRSSLQMIILRDTTPPTINIPADQTINNSPGNCSAFYDIPAIDASDECSDPSELRFDYYVNGVYTSQTQNIELPVGDNTIRVVVRDDCLNESEDTYQVTVVDVETPTVVCFDDNFSLPSTGDVQVGPEIFASIEYRDNCEVVDTLIRRVNSDCGDPSDQQFGDEITICCEDVGDTIMVEVKAVDASGNMNSCMFMLGIQDKLPPMLVCPADTTVNCDELGADYSGFGSPFITDNCNFTVDSSVTENLNSCKEGTIERKWIATDEFGNMDSCIQVITVENPYSFDESTIVWPNDTTLSACVMGGLHPDSINSRPEFQQTPCETVGVDFTDMTMDQDSACLHIMRTWTLTDSCENEDTTYVQMIRVINNAPPVLTVPSDTTLYANENCFGEARLDSAFTNDCSSGVVFENSYTSGGALVDTIFPLGQTQIIYTATDECNNVSTDTMVVTVVDTTSPEIICPADTVVSTDTGVCEAMVSIPLPDVSDNCAVISVTNDFNNSADASDVYPIGTTTVVFTVEDTSGNIDRCSFTVTVEDNEPPTLICPADTFLLYLDSTCSVEVPDFSDSITVSDNCTPVNDIVIDQTPMSGDILMNVQDTSIQIIVTDTSGNSDTCLIAIRLVDTIPPSIMCPDDLTLYVNENCEDTVGDYTDQAMVMSNCTQEMNVQVGQSPAPGTIISGADAVYVITLTAEDSSGNMMSCTFNITLEDTIPPMIPPLNDTVVNNDPGMCGAFITFNIPDITDNCILDTFYNDYNFTEDASDFYPVGDTIVRYIAEDESGNMAMDSFMVTVLDNEAPVVTCPATDTVYLDANCEGLITNYRDSVLVTDNCTAPEDIVIEQTPDSGTIYFGTGDTIVQIIVMDESGNSDTCNFTIVFVDTTSPELICPAPQTLIADQNCEAVIPDYVDDILLSDNCTDSSNMIVSQDPAPGTLIGNADTIITVTITAEDASGNSSQCSITVSIEDETPPSISCPSDVRVSADSGVCEAFIMIPTPTVGDNCGVSSITNDYNGLGDATDTYPVGTTSVVFTVTDINGNTNTCSFSVTVTDDEAPSLTCPPDMTLTLQSNCELMLPDFTGDASVSDNCAPTDSITLVQSPPPGTILVGDGDTTITIIATDTSGNMDTCSFILTRMDLVPPSITCPANDTGYVDTLCSYEIGNYRDSAIVSDNCTDTADITISQIPDSGTIIFGADTTVVISLIATDLSGNADTCTFNLTLLDTIPPEITCPDDVTIFADENCKAVIPDLTDSVVLSDNCDPDSAVVATQSPSPGDTLMGEQTIRLTFTITDMNGQVDSCSITLTVQDTTPPMLTCPPDTQLVADSLCQVVVPDFIPDADFSDNCTDSIDLVVTQDPAADSVIDAQAGDTIIVTIVVEDESGNTDSCEVIIEVIDTTPPTLMCTGNPDTVFLDANCAGAVPDLSSEITLLEDNCTSNSSITISQEPPAGTVFIVSGSFDTSVVITVTDGSGNSANCTIPLSFIDNTPPVLVCPPDSLVPCGYAFDLNDLTSDFGFATATDNCSGVSIVVTEQIFRNDCQQMIDSVERRFTATDDEGNSSMCTQTIRVNGSIVDLDSSDFNYPDTVITMDCNFIDPSDIPNSLPVLDSNLMACNVIGIEFSDSTNPNPTIGCIEIFRTFTVTDSCVYDPNTGEGQFELDQFVIVQDTSSPTFMVPTPDTTIYLDTCGPKDVILDTVTASDCAGIDTIYNNSPFAFDNSGGDVSGSYPFGIHNVNVYAEDSCGNVDSTTIIITVTDSFPDTLTCNFKIINNLDSNTLTAIFMSDEFFGSYVDSCGNPPLGEIETSFDPNDINDTIIVINCDSIDTMGGNYIQPDILYIFLDGMLIDSCDIELGIDNPEICNQNTLTGRITAIGGASFDGVRVNIYNELIRKEVYTNREGLYDANGLLPDKKYTVDPDYEGDPWEGISTFDLLLIYRHILNLDLIDDPYFNIAADIDKSGLISGSDLVHLKKLILRIEKQMPVDNWRFVRTNYEFGDPAHACSYDYAESADLMLRQSLENVNFYGLKVGDVDGSIDMNVLGRSAPTLLEVERGESGNIRFISPKSDVLYGFQMAISATVAEISLVDGAVGFKHEDYSINEDGQLMISWVAPNGVSVEEGELLFELADGDKITDLKQIQLDEHSMAAEIYWKEEGLPSLIKLKYEEEKEAYALYQNAPNPWMGKTIIPFSLENEGKIELRILNASGQEVQTILHDGIIGYNEIEIRESDLAGPGIYYYQLKGSGFEASKKMILLNP